MTLINRPPVAPTAPILAEGMAKVPPRRGFLRENPSLPWFLGLLTIFTLMVSVLSEGLGVGAL